MLTETQPQILTYRCPHCGTMVRAQASSDGTVVNCPAQGCGKPFRVEIPVATPAFAPSSQTAAPAAIPLGPRAPTAPTAPTTASPDPRAAKQAPMVTIPGDEPEHELCTFHLSMFRRYPWLCLGYLLIIAVGFAGTMWMWLRGWEWLSLICLGGTAFAFVRLGLWWLRIARTTLTFTNKHAILKTGVFSREANTIALDHLADFHLHQPLLMRWLNVGDLAIVSSLPQEQQLVIMSLHDPQAAARILQPYLEAHKNALAEAEGTAGTAEKVVTAPEPVHVG